jgi:hypothetical protein
LAVSPFVFTNLKAVWQLRDIQSLVALLLGSLAIALLALPVGRKRVWAAMPAAIVGIALWVSPVQIMVSERLASLAVFAAPASMVVALLFLYRRAWPFPDETKFWPPGEYNERR